MSRHAPHKRLVVGVAVIATTLTACATGPRPTLVDETVVDDAVAQAVLDRLDRSEGATFTADYEITPSLTGLPTHATVMQSGSQRRITIGDVDYYTDGTVSRTCVVGGTNCVDSIDEARVSNLNVTSSFWGASSAARLEVDSARSVDASTGQHRHHRQQAGHVCRGLPAGDRRIGCLSHDRRWGRQRHLLRCRRRRARPLLRRRREHRAHVVRPHRRPGPADVVGLRRYEPVRRRSVGGRRSSSRSGLTGWRRRCPRGACPTRPARRSPARC